MTVVSSVAASGTVGSGLRGCARLILALLMTGVAASTVLAADPPAEDQGARLNRLSTTIDNLKANLTAIRKDLEGMGSTSQPTAAPPPEPACAAPAKTAGEPQLAPGELDRLRSERAALKDRVAELEKTVSQMRTDQAGEALIKQAAAAPAGTPAPATKPAEPASVPQPGAAAAPADAGGETAQLRADLASAQLRIAELSDELRSTRANKAALEAELSSLRSLTDDKIKQFMGWR
jgi:DNA repair exonuclease SbcCD ATPase subunit